jgi:hypothetical protein
VVGRAILLGTRGQGIPPRRPTPRIPGRRSDPDLEPRLLGSPNRRCAPRFTPPRSDVSTDPRPASNLRLAGLFLVSCGLLLVQVALTKIFSIVLWYHFGFLVISLAMLGFATSGVWLSRRPELLDQGAGLLARMSSLAALVLTGSLWVVTHTQVNVSTLIKDHNEGALLAVVFAVGLPFFFLGASVSATLTMHRAGAGRVYSANLLGSGMGCAAAVALFDGLHLSATDVVLSSALLVAAGATLFALEARAAARLLPVAVVVGLLVLLGRDERHDWLRLIAPADKPLALVEKWERENDLRAARLASGEELLLSEYTFVVAGVEADPAEIGDQRLTYDGQPLRADEVLLESAAADGALTRRTALQSGWTPSDGPPVDARLLVRGEAADLSLLGQAQGLSWRGWAVEPGDLAFDVVTPYGDRRRVSAIEAGWVPGQPLPVDPDASLVEFTKWTSLSRVDAFTWPFRSGVRSAWGLWGLSPRWDGEMPRQKGITIDSWAMTNVMQWDRSAGDGRPPQVLEYLPAGLVHRIKPEARILCIGAGGGMDLLTALRFGAKQVVGVEINPSVVEAVRSTFLDFQGGLYADQPDVPVEINVAEGRHFLERDDRVYDVVQLSGVDTASTTQAGAFSLSENFLYTAEAFDTYLERTAVDGFVTLTRWVLPDRRTGHPRNTLRLFTLAWSALERAGVEDPRRHVYLVESQGFSVILFGRTPLSDEQLATLDATSEQLGFRSLYHPDHPSEYLHPVSREPMTNWYDEFAAAPDKGAFFAAYPYDVEPPTDDRPFFFETSRFVQLLERESFFNPLGGVTAHGILLVLFGLILASGWLFVIRPLRSLSLNSSEVTAGGVRRLPVLVYFASLGLGFILVEVVLSQQFILFLGNPLYSLAVVLFAVLLFSGVGSALSSKVGNPALALAAVIVLGALYPLLLPEVFDAALMLPTWGRIAVSVLLLAPLAVAMGMPFPLGLVRISGGDARIAAWAWGLNGYMSVVGSVLTIGLGLAFGFRMVVWIGAGVYALAFAASFVLVRAGGRTQVESGAGTA